MVKFKKMLLTATLGVALVSYAKASASLLEEADPVSVSVSQSHGVPRVKRPLPELPPLPDALWFNIIRRADSETRGNLALADRHMHELVRDPIEMSKRGEALRPRSKKEVTLCIAKFTDAIKNGVKVDLSFQDWVDNAVLAHLCNVRNINLWGCDNITDDGLKHLATIKTIKLNYCDRITDTGLRYLTNATKVTLVYCHSISDAGLAHLRGATSVRIVGCHQISDTGLQHLTNARKVYLQDCTKISDDGLAHLANIRDLELLRCPKISEAAKEALRKKGVRVRGHEWLEWMERNLFSARYSPQPRGSQPLRLFCTLLPGASNYAEEGSG